MSISNTGSSASITYVQNSSSGPSSSGGEVPHLNTLLQTPGLVKLLKGESQGAVNDAQAAELQSQLEQAISLTVMSEMISEMDNAYKELQEDMKNKEAPTEEELAQIEGSASDLQEDIAAIKSNLSIIDRVIKGIGNPSQMADIANELGLTPETLQSFADLLVQEGWTPETLAKLSTLINNISASLTDTERALLGKLSSFVKTAALSTTSSSAESPEVPNPAQSAANMTTLSASDHQNAHMLPNLMTSIWAVMQEVAAVKMVTSEVEIEANVNAIEQSYEWSKMAAEAAIIQGDKEAQELMNQAMAAFIQAGISAGMAAIQFASSYSATKDANQKLAEAKTDQSFYDKNASDPHTVGGQAFTKIDKGKDAGKWQTTFKNKSGEDIRVVVDHPPSKIKFEDGNGQLLTPKEFQGQSPPPAHDEVIMYKNLRDTKQFNEKPSGTPPGTVPPGTTTAKPATDKSHDADASDMVDKANSKLVNAKEHVYNLYQQITVKTMVWQSLGETGKSLTDALTKFSNVNVVQEKAAARAEEMLSNAVSQSYTTLQRAAEESFNKQIQGNDAIFDFLKSFSENLSRLVFRG